jgi:hypothetical protein
MWSGSQKLPKNIFNRYRFPAGLWIIDCLQEDNGGRSRDRTYDPLIKSQLLYQLSYAPELPSAGEAPSDVVRLAKASRSVQPRKTEDNAEEKTKSAANENRRGEPGGFLRIRLKASGETTSAASR